MNLSPAFEQAISILHERLQTLPHPWAFTGSLSMALQGLDFAVNDIDVQSDQGGAHAIQALLSEFITRPVVYSGTERIRSHFGGLEIHGVKVDVIGDVQTRPPDGDWVGPPDLPSLIHWVEYSGLRLPVLNLEYELTAYTRMGRAAKAARIRHFLDNRDEQTK